jgi:hypothetical protein
LVKLGLDFFRLVSELRQQLVHPHCRWADRPRDRVERFHLAKRVMDDFFEPRSASGKAKLGCPGSNFPGRQFSW